MESLEAILDALQKEVSRALSKSEPLPGHVKWQADRIVVTLALAVKSEGHNLKFEFAKPNASTPANSLSIEFKIANNATTATTQSEPTPKHETPAAENLTGSAIDEVTATLNKVFGKPGFDSSARATVFCEACENLSPQHAADLFKNLTNDRSVSDSREVKRAHSLIHRVCQSGPAGSVEGRKIVADVFQTWDLDAVLRIIAETWKTQEDWLTKSL